MYVKRDEERQYSFLLSLLTLTVLLTLVHFNSKILSAIDGMLQKLVVNIIPNNNGLNHVLSFFSHPLMCVFYALVIWFLMWGFKHKIPATWVLVTFFSGEVILIIMHDLNRPEYISGSFFSSLLVVYAIFTMVIPLVSGAQRQKILKVGLIVLVTLIGLAHVQLGHVSVIGLLISWLPVNAWLQICRGQYLKRFVKLYQYPIFKHSDFN